MPMSMALDMSLAGDHAAVDALLAAADRAGAAWSRALVFNRTLRKNAFPNKMKASAAFDPASGSDPAPAFATPPEARLRVEGALNRFDQACRARAATGQNVMSTIFGAVSVADFARFQELHIRHHYLQMPGVA